MQTPSELNPASGCFACSTNPAHVFACLTAREKAIPDGAHVPHIYKRDQVLFHEGTPALAVYCIQFGTVRLSRTSRRGVETVIGTRSAGDVVGFRAALADLPHAETAVAILPSRVCAIPREAFLDLVRGSPPLALELLRVVAIRSRMTEDQLISRAQEPVVHRTVRLLLATHRKEGVQHSHPIVRPPEISREEMALLIGTTRETLSRTLHELADRGLLEVSPSGVLVRDVDRLRATISA